MEREIDEIREEIDGIDNQIADLFVRRMALAAEVADYKASRRLPVLNQKREREIMARILKRVGEPMEKYARILFATLFDLSRSYQACLSTNESALALRIRAAMESGESMFPGKGSVACQGVEGAFSQIACDKLFAAPEILYFRSFEGVFSAVENGLCEYGVLPIENSSYGSVNEVYDLMRRHDFHIVRSIRLRVKHTLLAKPGTKLEDIRVIYSHEQAIGQCSEFLNKRKEIRVSVCENTAAAAQMVAESDREGVAAISSKICADLYGLSVLSEQVQNSDNNYTRFICITKKMTIYPGANRISLMFALAHKPGSLYSVMSKISSLGININKLESRPIPGSEFEFMFYFDLEASVWTPETVKLLCDLEKSTEQFVFLGSYSEI